jgi:hypothetical protein
MNDEVVRDDLGPEIEKMFLNAESFREGDDVNETPFFYAEVFDEDGINRIGNGSGHSILICIDNQAKWTYPLNDYFRYGDTPGSGSVGFLIPELPAGRHRLWFRVWDIMNNMTTDSLTFNVVKGLKPEVSVIWANPNPAREKVEFRLEHNRPESVLEVEIRVYDLAGRVVWTHTESGSSAYPGIYSVEWNLSNGSGSKTSPGVYVYQAIVKTTGGKNATKAKKLVVL